MRGMNLLDIFMKEYYISIIIFHKPIALETISIIQNSDTNALALENV